MVKAVKIIYVKWFGANSQSPSHANDRIIASTSFSVTL